jgi:hypothetical protein
MPMMPPPFLVTDVEVSTAIGLAGIVATGSFALVYKAIDIAYKERAEERATRAKEADASRAATIALEQVIATLERIR